MKPKFFLLLVALAISSLALRAQQRVSLESMQAALKVREAIATEVAQGAETPAKALLRLQKESNASGLSQQADADLAYAALDIGHRLIALHRPEAAEVFFRAAETGFEQASNRTPRGQAKQKAEYLRNLAFVRGSYLNKAEASRADIDEAIRLRPNDRSLQETRQVLARGKVKSFENNGKN